MADDTRLVEACLLLNYSSQSHKEQMLAKKQTQQHQQEVVSIKREPNYINSPEIVTSSELITPKSENGFNTVNHQEFETFSDTDCSSFPEPEVNLVVDSLCSPPLNNNVTNDVMSTYVDNNCDNSRAPTNSLLAAVNCALPEIKNRRPTILQRSSNHMTVLRSLNPTPVCIPDHEYCLQEHGQSSLSHNSDAHSETSHDQDNATNETPYKPVIMLPDSNQGIHHSKRKEKHPNSLKSFSVARKPLKLVAVHLGAGNSSNDTDSLYFAKLICQEMMLQRVAPDWMLSSKRKRKTSSYLNNHDSMFQHRECRLEDHIADTQMIAELAVVQLIKRMEDHQTLNCGYGSNLNIMGQAECDASLMSDRVQMWAGVGALAGCRNPILLAKSLFDHRTVPRPLGLVQPNLLVGSGAKLWMREHCSYLSVTDCKLISSKSFSVYQKLKSRYDAAIRSINWRRTGILRSKSEAYSSTLVNRSEDSSQPRSTKERGCHEETAPEKTSGTYCSSTSLDHGFYCLKTRDNLQRHPSFARIIQRFKDFEGSEIREPVPEASNSTDSEVFVNDLNNHRLDTVGAVAVDSDNNFASAISSGGLLLKYKGRIGQAAIPGAGCWSEDSVAVTTTGVGEYLTLNLFAKKIYDKMLTLRLLFDLGHVEEKEDISSLISCGIDECFQELQKLPAMAHVPTSERLAGMLSVSTLNSKDLPNRVSEKDLYLSYAHNTESMCIGYMTCNDISGHSLMSRRINQDDDNPGEVLVRTMKFSLDPTYYVDSCFDNGSSQL